MTAPSLIPAFGKVRQIGRALLLAAALPWLGNQACGDVIHLQEYAVKAALLFNVAKYTDWPPQSFADAQSPIIIGVLGDDPFGQTLDRIVNGRSVHGRPIQILRSSSVAVLQRAHLVFVSASQPHAVQDCVVLGEANVLTVADTESLARYTAVTFAVQNDKVVFSVNLPRSKHTGAKFSSKLLKLAHNVRRADGTVGQ